MAESSSRSHSAGRSLCQWRENRLGKRSRGATKERFTVPGGLQNFGHLIVSLVDPSPQPVGVLIESIRIGPLPSPIQAQTTEIQFRQGVGRSPFLLSGWFSSETWGVWTQGEQASLYFPGALLVSDPSISILRPIPLWRRFKEFKSARNHLGQWGVAGRTASRRQCRWVSRHGPEKGRW